MADGEQTSRAARPSTAQGAARNSRQEGRLDLRLERTGGVTRPLRCMAQPPLQLSRVRYDDPAQPDLAALTLVHLGGILAGDRYRLEVELGAGAAARITTAAATQVYRMPRDDASQEICLRLEPGSRLAWLPEPLILFAGARFAQTMRIELSPGARLELLEVLVPGRLSRGEVYQFERYAMSLEVTTPDGRCLAAERAILEPARADLAAPGLFDDTPVLGSLYMLGDSVDAERGCGLVAQRDDSRLAATVLPNDCGLLVRTLGMIPSQVRRVLLDIRQAIA